MSTAPNNNNVKDKHVAIPVENEGRPEEHSKPFLQTDPLRATDDRLLETQRLAAEA
jgi:hypothetical protein